MSEPLSFGFHRDNQEPSREALKANIMRGMEATAEEMRRQIEVNRDVSGLCKEVSQAVDVGDLTHAWAKTQIILARLGLAEA